MAKTTTIGFRSFRLAPGRLVAYMLAVEALLLLTERFKWFPFNTHKGWTVLIVLASASVLFASFFLCFAASLLFRLRFQFSVRLLLMLVLVVAVPCSWLALDRKASMKQAEVVKRLEAYSWVGYEWQVDANGQLTTNTRPPSPQSWLHNLLGKDFFSGVVLVEFRGNKVMDDEIEPIKCLKQLQWLGLDEAKITDDGLQCVRELTQLKWLNLDNTQITDVGLKYIEGLKKLEWLDLDNTQITDAGLGRLERLTQLKAIEINDTRITDAGIEHLKELTKLQVLMLANTQVTDTGLKYLKRLTELQELWLDHTQITDSGLEYLKGLAQLQEIHLMDTKVTDMGIRDLQKALPRAKIWR